MAKDRIGNKLEVGDLVQYTLQLGEVNIIGRVKSISGGGDLVMIGGQKLAKGQSQVKGHFTPETVKVVFDFDVWNTQPGEMEAANLLKIQDNDPKAKALMQEQESRKGLLPN